MGQAKARGMFEERQSDAVERDRLAAIEAERMRVEHDRALTPEERERRRQAQINMAYITGLVGMFNGRRR